jgi:hypothetical protein
MDAATVEKFVIEAGPAGVTADAVEKAFAGVSRSTVNRRLASLLEAGCVRTQGGGRMTRYLATGPFALDSFVPTLRTTGSLAQQPLFAKTCLPQCR